VSFTALIVDDESLARERIRTLLHGDPDIDVVGEIGDGRSAVRALAESPHDLVFLDVQMPELGGFEVLETLCSLQKAEPEIQVPAVVFVTAYDRYALRAFEVHALDYLLKPFDVERFEKTLARVKVQLARLRGEALSHELAALLDERRRSSPFVDKFVVRSRGRIVFVRSEEIDWIEAAGNYVAIHVGARNHLLRETMSHLESQLDPTHFMRIHRSFIVPLDRIEELNVSERGDYEVALRNGTRLASSRTYYRRLKKRLEAQ
jgi:two-component system LytT family response regulator